MDPIRPEAENPYAPPKSDVNVAAPTTAVAGDLAERGTRFVSQLVDGLFFLELHTANTTAGFLAISVFAAVAHRARRIGLAAAEGGQPQASRCESKKVRNLETRFAIHGFPH